MNTSSWAWLADCSPELIEMKLAKNTAIAGDHHGGQVGGDQHHQEGPEGEPRDRVHDRGEPADAGAQPREQQRRVSARMKRHATSR